MSHRYGDSDSEGDDFNPAPEVDATSEDGRRQNYDEPDSPADSRANNHRRSSVSRDDEDGDAPPGRARDEDGDEDENQDEPPRKRRDDDDDEEDEDEDEEDEDDEDDMPVRPSATLLSRSFNALKLRT